MQAIPDIRNGIVTKKAKNSGKGFQGAGPRGCVCLSCMGKAEKIFQKVAQNTATFAQMRPIVVVGVTYRNFARSNKNAHRD